VLILYQQQPTPTGGSRFKLPWFRMLPERPKDVISWVRFWDVAATEDGGDWTVGALIGITSLGYVIIADIVRGQWSPGQVDAIMYQTAVQDGYHVAIREEQEGGSSGKTVTSARSRSTLQGYDYLGIPASGAKQLRWNPLAAQAESGNVFLVAGPWNKDFLSEITHVPNWANDDQADAASGGYNAAAGTDHIQQIRLAGH
jgi:predicted phage terminase large subunit-like protein